MKQKSKIKNQKAKIQIKYQKFFLVATVALGLALRLVNLQSWFHFEFDEEVIAWKLRPLLQEGKPFLIGGGTPFGFHLGPAFYYLSAIPLFFSRLDPIGWGVMAAIFGTVTVWLMWIVGRTLYNQRIGLIAAGLWATSFTAVMNDRHWWPLVLDPMLALIVTLCLYKISVIPAKARFDSARRAGIYLNRFLIKSGMTMIWVILGLTLAFAWQTDLTVLPLFLAAGAVAILNLRRQWKGILAAIVILLVSSLPLILFEFRHPGQNLSKLFAYEFLLRSDLGYPRSDLIIRSLAEATSFVPQSLSRLLFPMTHLDGNLLNFYSWCKEMADGRVANQPWWAVVLTVIILLSPFYKRGQKSESVLKADRGIQLIVISGIAGILIYKLFGGNLYDFYLAVLYPVVVILFARAADFIWRKWGAIAGGAIILAIVGLNLTTVAKAYHPQSLAAKQAAVAWVADQTSGKEFELDSLSECSRYNGIRYLFFLEKMEPAISFVDNDLSWLYPNQNKTSNPEYLVTFVTPDDLTSNDSQRYDRLVLDSIAKKKFGAIDVIVSKVVTGNL